MGEKLHFHIDHIDPLGQGVHKDGATVCFIPKTLPGETGEAEIIKRTKGVSFGRVIELETLSPQRIEAACVHFNQCPGCQFLHAPYELELESKKNSLARLLRSLNITSLKTHAAPRRWSYRNRMQLHYDVHTQKLGVNTPSGITAIPSCLMPNEKLKDAFESLYKNWLFLVKNEPDQGHIEIYEKNGEVQTSINRPYAEGGFSQVFDEMNRTALDLVTDYAQKLAPNSVLDLFGGAGNLSLPLTEANVLVVDGIVPDQALAKHQEFFQLNLYSKGALQALERKFPEKVDLMLVDPPRSGFTGLGNFVSTFKPDHLIYMSCFAPSLMRDLKEINPVSIDVHLLDFFPSTHHYETLTFIKLK